MRKYVLALACSVAFVIGTPVARTRYRDPDNRTAWRARQHLRVTRHDNSRRFGECAGLSI
jgi:hypothetical protein